jgi:tetratricopeptide (TPR) repeat protein
MKPKMLPEPVLVGREHELEELKEYLNFAFEGKGETVFISGEAGSGKTRLLDEFLKILSKKDVIVLTGWCLSEAPVPYFPFIEAFDSLPTGEGKNAITFSQRIGLKSWLLETNQSEASEKPVGMQPQIWRDHAFYGVANELLFLSSKKPLVLALDDIHWADSASLSLLHYLARQLASERILVLATFRCEELTPDAEGNSHPLSKTLLLMDRDDLYKEVKLSNLDVSDIHKIAESMLVGSVQSEFVNKLACESHGNPLFVVEYLRTLHQQGKLFKENGQWRLFVGDFDIPRKVKDVVLQRLEGLRSHERKILDVASVVGENFDPELLAAVVSQDSADVLRTVTDIAKSKLIVHCEGKSCWFDHAKFREMLYMEIPLLLRKEYHLKVAEKIEAVSMGLAEAPVSELAYHFVRAENKLKAIKYSLRAGEVALSRFSNMEAIQHFLYVLNSVKDYPELVNEKLSALEGLGNAFYANSQFKKATGTFEELGDTAETGVMKLQAFRKATESAYQQGDSRRMLELIKKAAPYTAAGRLENARVLACRSRALMLQSKPYLIDLEDALHVFEEEYSLWDVAWALMGVGNKHAGRGMDKDHQGLAEALRSIALFGELGDFRSQMEVCFVAGFDFINCMLYNEALDVYAKIIAIDENMKMGDYLHACYAYAWSGVLFFIFKDDLEKGLSYNLKALELSKKTDSLVAQGTVYSNLVREYAVLGDVDRAEECFEKLLKLPQEIFNFNPVSGEFAKAVLLAAKGQGEVFEKLFERMKASPYACHWSGWLQGAKWQYARMLERQGRVEEARIHLDEIKRNRQDADKKFEHANVQPSLMVRRQGVVGEEVEMRLDLVNVARNPCTLTNVEGLIPLGSKIVSFPSFCSIQNSSINLNGKRIDPFQVETIKLRAIFGKAGVYKLEPRIFYVDDFNETRTCEFKPLTLTVQFSPSEDKEKRSLEFSEGKLSFKSEAAEKAFNFLVKAFEEDYIIRRMTSEKCGWRTLMETARNARVTMYSMYGRYGRGGEALSELGRLGVVESRFFYGERGRSGRVLKIRVACEKEFVKKLLGHGEPKSKLKENLPN